ncbi:Mu transposase C-terminal domain-containing protein [Cytobacillus oceanisediminis]|uniref:Mu transposase C-terminal domain-containing protein n=1 Tax=Cytobacillus oceanisediminis TaxID=665099 RepID=UPI0020799DBC|nr:Mu transposase C-terminal domain-containing protein [Cytobacillus oceanisediminis]USK44097.1 Mu transposase C-terminal domain-containing protein [Cytobacillus oceanisediminis]
MTTKIIKIGDEFMYYGVKQRVYDIDPPNVIVNRIGGDNKIFEINYFTLITDPNFKLTDDKREIIVRESKNEKQVIVSFLDALSEKQRDIVSRKFEIIKPILLYESIKEGNFVSNHVFNEEFPHYLDCGETILDLSKEELYRRISKKNNKSERQIKRYVSAYKKEENELDRHGMNGLIRKNLKSRIVRNDERAIQICDPYNPEIVLDVIYSRISEEQGKIIKEAIEKHFLKKRKISIANLHETIEIMCVKQDVKTICYPTIYNILKRLNPSIKNIYRIGNSEDYQETTRGFSNQFAKAPLHIVEIDHTKLDIDVIDEKTGINLGRPWITMGIDVYTRMIWCFHISFDDPSADKVRKAIKHGIFFKNAKQKYNTINEWEISGIPSIIYFDNGSEFANAAVKRLVSETLKAQYMFRPIATPRYGGVIERFFGTINKEFIHRLAGTRKSNPKELGEYDAEKEAIFTLEDIEELITTYIVDVYHHSIHKGLPLDVPTPTARYYQAINSLGFPPFIPKEEEEYYNMELLPTEWRKYTKDGIRFGNVYYSSSETTKFLKKKQGKYQFKYDIDDISKIYLLDPDEKVYNEVPARNPSANELAGMKKKTYKLILSFLRECGDIAISSIPGSRLINKAKASLAQKVEKMMRKNKKARRQALTSDFKNNQLIYSQSQKSSNKGLSKVEILKQKVNAGEKKGRDNF